MPRPLAPTLIALLLCAAPATGHAAGFLASPRGEVRGGERIEVRWRELPATVHEVELELSLDGGRWLRVSPELEPREHRFAWRVPQMAATSARLRLRAGGEQWERVLAVGDPFRIVSTGPAIACETDAEWWHVGEHAAASGWRQAARGPVLASERHLVAADSERRAQGRPVAAAAAWASLAAWLPVGFARSTRRGGRAFRRHPLRL